jgi:hypothetical protein
MELPAPGSRKCRMEISHAHTPDRKRGDRETAALALPRIAEI